MSKIFASGGQSLLELQLQHQSFQWIFRIDWFISFQSKGLSRDFSNTTVQKQCLVFFMVQLSHLYMTTGKTIALTRWTFVGKIISLLFNMLSRLVIAFLPRSKHLLISWLQSPSAVILEPRERKYVTVSIVSPSICHETWVQSLGWEDLMEKEMATHSSIPAWKMPRTEESCGP